MTFGDSEAQPIPINPIQLFIEGDKERYPQADTFTVHNSAVSLWLPVNETAAQPQNANYYADKIISATNKVHAVFGTLPPDITYLFFETTDDWNKYDELTHGRLHKTQRDRFRGRAGRRSVVAFTRRGLRSQTNILDESQVPEAYRDDPNTYVDHSVQQLIDHETAHVQRIEMGVHIPAWYDEGMSTIITPLPRATKSPSSLNRIASVLAPFEEFPTEQQLQDSGIQNIFGIYYLDWVLQNCTPSLPFQEDESPDSFRYSNNRLHVLVEVLNKMQDARLFDSAFQDIFGLSSQEAYIKFKASLKIH